MRIGRIIGIGAAVTVMAFGFAQCAPTHSAAPVSFPPCTTEDGSDPSQTFPCEWDATTQGNGIGTSYVLTMRPCTADERRAAAAAWLSGHARPLECTTD